MQTTRDLVGLLQSIDHSKPICSMPLPVSLDDQAAFEQRMKIITSHSTEAAPGNDLAEIEAQAKLVIANSAALVDAIVKTANPAVTWFNVPNPIFTFVGRFDQLNSLK